MSESALNDKQLFYTFRILLPSRTTLPLCLSPPRPEIDPLYDFWHKMFSPAVMQIIMVFFDVTARQIAGVRELTVIIFLSGHVLPVIQNSCFT
jgi:hypothetical protein